LKTKILKKIFIFTIIFAVIHISFIKISAIPENYSIENNYFFPKLRWDDFYKLDKNSLDLVYLGSSHCYKGFDPKIIDQITGLNSFNLGSSSQSQATSYFVLKEMLKSQKPKYLIFEIYWDIFQIENHYTNSSYNFKYFKNNEIIKELIFSIFSVKDYANYIFPYINFDEIIHSLMLIAGGKTLNNNKNIYSYRGYVKNSNTISLETLKNENEFKNYTFDKSKSTALNLEYLYKTIELCKKNNIEIVLITAPIAPVSYDYINNYSDIYNFGKTIADNFSIKLYDYNILNHKNRIFNNTNFFDEDHLNESGVNILCNDISNRIIKGEYFDKK